MSSVTKMSPKGKQCLSNVIQILGNVKAYIPKYKYFGTTIVSNYKTYTLMKKYILICAMGLASCTGSNDQTSNTATEDTITVEVYTIQQNKPYCFLRTEGSDNQDTTTVHLIVNANKVTGEMHWTPKEKDSRTGILTGTISGDEISAVWSYMQEGMKDTMTVAFKLSAQQLAQKPLKLDPATGREETDEAASYTLLYETDSCGD